MVIHDPTLHPFLHFVRNVSYYFGSQRVAARIAGTLFYMQGDHLGSSSLVMTTSGTLNTRQTYFPYGAKRTTEGSPLPMDYTFTGQKSDDSTGLMFYNARYYDTTLGRFTQADTIVPSPMNPQSLNRYGYVRNNPINLTDPTGHEEGNCEQQNPDCDAYFHAQGVCWNHNIEEYSKQCPATADNPDVIEDVYGVEVEGLWSGAELNALVRALHAVVNAFNELTGYGLASFKNIWGGIIIRRCHEEDIGCVAPEANWVGDYSNGVIRLFDGTFRAGYSATKGIIHELGHAWDYKVRNKLATGMAQFIGASQKGCDSLPVNVCTWRVFPKQYAGGLYGRPPNAVEDWADSFMVFVVDFKARTENYSNLRNIYVMSEMIGGGIGVNSCAESFVYLNPWRCP